jgi:hypothetical protein
VSDLYLAEGKARTKIWTRAAEALAKLKVPKSQIDHIVQSDNPALLVNQLKELLDKS